MDTEQGCLSSEGKQNKQQTQQRDRLEGFVALEESDDEKNERSSINATNR